MSYGWTRRAVGRWERGKFPIGDPDTPPPPYALGNLADPATLPEALHAFREDWRCAVVDTAQIVAARRHDGEGAGSLAVGPAGGLAPRRSKEAGGPRGGRHYRRNGDGGHGHRRPEELPRLWRKRGSVQ